MGFELLQLAYQKVFISCNIKNSNIVTEANKDPGNRGTEKWK